MVCLTEPNATYPGLAYTETLANMGHNKALYAKLAELFVDQHGQDIEQLEQALEQGDQVLALNLTHALRGTAGNLGAITLYHSAGEFESALDRDELSSAALRPVKQAMAELLVSLATLISDLTAPVSSH